MTIRRISLAATAFLLSLPVALGGCGGDDGEPPGETGGGGLAPETGPVAIAFAHLVGGAPVVIGEETPYVNAAGNAFGVTRVTYFVSDVTLTLQDGTEVTAQGAHYVDHDLPETMQFQLSPELAGRISTVSFVMGLPPALNVAGAFPSAPESLMEWPAMMGGGYHNLKFEGRYLNDAGEPFNFKMHSGPLNGADHSFAVSLDAGGRAISGAGTTLTLEMNLERWFTGASDWDLDEYFNLAHPGIMGDAGAQSSLSENGSTVFTLGSDQP